jgi:hypothetical protein
MNTNVVCNFNFMKSGVIFISILVLYGCSNGLELGDSNVYKFSGDGNAYFPTAIKSNLDTTKDEFFNADVYSELLHQLHEKSLSDRFCGTEIVRLTVKTTFKNHFMIKIGKRDDGRFFLTEKEVWRDKGFTVDSANYMVSSHIQFDSAANKFFKVKMVYKNPPLELQREEIEPVSRRSSKEITEDQWNNLVMLLDKGSFYSLRPRIYEFGFDGNWYLVETHSKNGYYLVDRWSPDNGGFKDVVDYLVSLTGREVEN